MSAPAPARAADVPGSVFADAMEAFSRLVTAGLSESDACRLSIWITDAQERGRTEPERCALVAAALERTRAGLVADIAFLAHNRAGRRDDADLLQHALAAVNTEAARFAPRRPARRSTR